MADISTITVNGTQYNISDDMARENAVYYVKGTQTASTNAWTGNLPEVDELYDGLTINYWLPFAGTSSSATLALTLGDGTTTDAIPVYYGGTTRVTTQQSSPTVWQYVYQTVTISNTEYTGWWAVRAYYNNTTYSVFANLNHNNGQYTANSVVYRYQMIFHMSRDVVTPLNNNSNATGTTKTMLTDVEFDPFDEIYYYANSSTINADAPFITYLCWAYDAVDLRYTFNCGKTLVTNKDVYLQVTMLSNGKCKIANTMPITQTLPSTNDGIYYIFLGRAYSTYQMSLYPYHPIFYHDGTSLRILQNPQDADATTTAHGYMSAADKTKLDGIAANANNYSLPTAAADTLGGVKVGTNLSIDANGVLSATDTNTDTQVTNTKANTTKAYLTGTSSASTNTGTQVFDDGVYVTTTAGQLNATTYKVNEHVTLQWNATDSSLDFVFA